MMQKLIKGAVLGGVILFIWGFVAWMVLPWNKMHMMKFKNEQKVAQAVMDGAPTSGIYVLPNYMDMPKHSKERAVGEQEMRQGPYVFAAVSLTGRDPSMAMSMIQGFIVKVIGAFLVTWLLLQTKLAFRKQVGFITVVGLTVGFLAAMPYVIWFGFPAMFAWACIFETTIGWFLAGLGIARALR
jgi:hypothetical protein